jgi:hypothetical protein
MAYLVKQDKAGEKRSIPDILFSFDVAKL